MPICVRVVDDQFKDFEWRLSAIEGIEFTGLTTFTPEAIFKFLDDLDAPTVMLLDILGKDGNEAGITLFNALGKEQRWQDNKGSVQIVFFSNKPTEYRQYTIAKAKRIDVAGYVKKNDMFAGNEASLSILRRAHDIACRYRKFPSLADPIRSEEHTSELQSPLNLVCRLLLEKKKTKTRLGTRLLGDRHHGDPRRILGRR